MKTQRYIFLSTLLIGSICFFILAYKNDFSFYETENYSDMKNLCTIISEGNLPNNEQLKAYELDGISYYKYEYSSNTDIISINVYGQKYEHSEFTFSRDLDLISYKTDSEYGFNFFIIAFSFILVSGIFPALVITFFIFIVKKLKEKLKKKKEKA